MDGTATWSNNITSLNPAFIESLRMMHVAVLLFLSQKTRTRLNMSYVPPRDTRKVRLDGLGVSLTVFHLCRDWILGRECSGRKPYLL